jgi:predicted Zn-dependent protease with MMP-like domain
LRLLQVVDRDDTQRQADRRAARGQGCPATGGEETLVTRDQFRELVQEAIDSIPRRFAAEIKNVAIVIEDRPARDLLEEMEMGPDEVLLGLYQGTPLPERQWAHGNALPDRITLFQGEIEEDCDGDEDEIVVAIGETLIHELGHYFGLSEDEIMEIEERYWRGESA